MTQLQADKLILVQRWVGHSEEWLKGFLSDAPLKTELVAIVAMGSAVRNRGHRRSDFDLLLVGGGKRLSVSAPMEVDIRFAAAEQLEGLLSNADEIICWAMKFGVAIYDPKKCWGHLQDEWKDRIPLPSAVEARTRANKTLNRAKEMLELGDDSAADDLVLAALTQFARERLLKCRVFPASRPELPDQLRQLNSNDPIAALLESAMFGDSTAEQLTTALENLDL